MSCTRLKDVCLVLMHSLSLLLIFSETDGSDHEDGGDGKENPPKGRQNTDDEKKDRFKKLNGGTLTTMSATNTK